MEPHTRAAIFGARGGPPHDPGSSIDSNPWPILCIRAIVSFWIPRRTVVLKNFLCALLLAGTLWAQAVPSPKPQTNEDVLWHKFDDRVTHIANQAEGVVGVSIVDPRMAANWPSTPIRRLPRQVPSRSPCSPNSIARARTAVPPSCPTPTSSTRPTSFPTATSWADSRRA